MDLKHVSDIPEYDSRVADIMLSISMERPGNPMESQSKRVVPQYLAEQKIPTSVEEFLKMEGLVCWRIYKLINIMRQTLTQLKQ